VDVCGRFDQTPRLSPSTRNGAIWWALPSSYVFFGLRGSRWQTTIATRVGYTIDSILGLLSLGLPEMKNL